MSTTAAGPLAGLSAVLLASWAFVAPLAAQEIRGVALDSEGRPIAGTAVALHRVGGPGAGTVATATTDATGGFAFEIEAADSAIYFVAMRHGDRIYIGPPARGGEAPILDYALRADPAAEAGAVASALSGGPPRPLGGPPSDGPGGGAGAAWLVGLLALTTAGLFLLTAPRYRTRRRRELLIELAAVENSLATGTGDVDRDTLESRRAALRERLGPAT